MEHKQRRPTPQSNGTESLRTFSTQYHSAALNPLFPMAVAPPPLQQPSLHPADAIVRPQSCNNNFHSSHPGYWPHEISDYEDGEDEEALYSSSTLPKPPPPLKGILKNTQPAPQGHATCSAFSASAELLFAEMDVLPFDNVPPCDDCVAKAKIKENLFSQPRSPPVVATSFFCGI